MEHMISGLLTMTRIKCNLCNVNKVYRNDENSEILHFTGYINNEWHHHWHICIECSDFNNLNISRRLDKKLLNIKIGQQFMKSNSCNIPYEVSKINGNTIYMIQFNGSATDVITISRKISKEDFHKQFTKV